MLGRLDYPDLHSARRPKGKLFIVKKLRESRLAKFFALDTFEIRRSSAPVVASARGLIQWQGRRQGRRRNPGGVRDGSAVERLDVLRERMSASRTQAARGSDCGL